MSSQWRIPPAKYRPIWLPAALVPTVLAPINVHFLVRRKTAEFGALAEIMSMILYLGLRTWQFVMCITGGYFANIYWIWQHLFLTLICLITILYAVFPPLDPLGLEAVFVGIFILWNFVVAVVERWMVGDAFRHFMIERSIITCLGFVVTADSASDEPVRKSIFVRIFARLKFLLGRRSTGPIALPPDNEPVLELGRPRVAAADSTWNPPPELSKNITQWAQLATEWDTHKTLWITADSEERRSEIARVASRLFSSDPAADPSKDHVILVDVSQTHSVFWPLVRGMAEASPEYLQDLIEFPPDILSFHFPWYAYRRFVSPPRVSTWSYYEDTKELIRDLFIRPVNRIHRELKEGKRKKGDQDKRREDSDVELAVQSAPEMTRTTLIVHGLRNNEQSDEIWDLADQLKDKLKSRFKAIGLVIVSEPALLYYNSKDDRHFLDYFCAMHVAESGFISYSGVNPTPPVLCENLFLLWVDGIHRVGGSQTEKMWGKVLKLSLDAGTQEEKPESSTATIAEELYNGVQDRKIILKRLSDIPLIKRSQIIKNQGQDNIKFANKLQQLFELNYRREIATVPREHAIGVLNLTHDLLDVGLPDNDVIPDIQVFFRRAHRLLNLLAAHLKLLPEELAVTDVVLLSEHPTKHGGFSNIYHAQFKSASGEQKQVALKVLKIFEDQSEERRHVLHDKFTREALVWRYLKHTNVVPFLGVDSTTFPSPARAMVSPWMPQGSVLKYMAENSPVGGYAVELINDVIKGLKYLHSVNIVHGDLCGRNILINTKGRACLTDFGLAGFVESDATIKSSTRSGSVRWMSPELIAPPPGVSFKRTIASDVWAFGCVCGERKIWTEGLVPFSHFPNEMGIIFAMAEPANSQPERPYQIQPTDRRGTRMPDRLWEVAQWCWKYDVPERPAVQVVFDILAELKRQQRPNADVPFFEQDQEEDDCDAPPVAGSSGTRHTHLVSSDNSLWSDTSRASSSSSSVADAPPTQTSAAAKGKQRVVHFDEELPAVVRFGPLEVAPDADYEDVFFILFEMLRDLVSRRALVEPQSIHPHDADYIDLHFRNELEANGFAMTWTVHRFDPYLDCNAVLVDGE
ncbi:hypothetical protein C8R45DRAFT_1081570 [Mycena sanguinolenta]|nr:hypothetical protein C8R45DRAFT_1081570 [Mycena sanguinolenta]